MSIDFRKTQNLNHQPAFIRGEPIEAIAEYKNSTLNTKTQQIMYFLKKLLSFNVHNNMLKMFYCAFIENEMCLLYHLLVW